MELSGLGGGLMLAIAAALWLTYLLPNWFKRREYLVTERNAARLEQSIRLLAQSNEALRTAPSEAPRAAQSNGPVAVGRAVSPPLAVDRRVEAARRLRRTRAVTSLFLLAALVLAGVQLSQLLVAGPNLASSILLGSAILAAGVCLNMLSRIARVARARRASAARPARRTSLGADPVAPEQQPVGWTPVPLPRPLYLSRPAAQSFQVLDAAFELELAAASAERALRAIDKPPAIEPAARGFTSMGIVDDTFAAVPDLDAVLARRRAAG